MVKYDMYLSVLALLVMVVVVMMIVMVMVAMVTVVMVMVMVVVCRRSRRIRGVSQQQRRRPLRQGGVTGGMRGKLNTKHQLH